MCFADFSERRWGDESWKECVAHPEAHKSRRGSGGIGEGGRGNKHPPGLVADVGYGRGNESQDDERDEEPEKLAENSVEGRENASEPDGEELPGENTERYCDKDFYKKIDLR